MKTIKDVTTIITHPGQAHRDEFMALCLLVAAAERNGDDLGIERRDHTEDELDDSSLLILDQGGKHDPDMLNFDHHQLDRFADPTCSITLVLPLLGIDPEEARRIWGWLKFSEMLDSKGPFATASHYGMSPDSLFATVSPIETTVLRWFERETDIAESQPAFRHGEEEPNPLYDLMVLIGQEKLSYLDKLIERLDLLRLSVDTYSIGAKPGVSQGVDVIDASCIPREQSPQLGLEVYCQELQANRGFKTAITITQDDRGEGLCLFRRNDDPNVDFSQIEGEDEVLFAHKSGFVAKLHPGVSHERLQELLKASLVVSVEA